MREGDIERKTDRQTIKINSVATRDGEGAGNIFTPLKIKPLTN